MGLGFQLYLGKWARFRVMMISVRLSVRVSFTG